MVVLGPSSDQAIRIAEFGHNFCLLNVSSFVFVSHCLSMIIIPVKFGQKSFQHVQRNHDLNVANQTELWACNVDEKTHI